MTTATAVFGGRALAKSRTTATVMIAGFALATAAAAQVTIPLWFTPVPVSGSTFMVLISGAVLGMRAGAASQLLYVVLGAVGLPFYAGGESGWTVATGATGGYLVGFIIAAALVGYLAERGQDRTVASAIPAMLAGNIAIYLLGIPWLMHVAGWNLGQGIAGGLTPFILGDLVKIGLASLALPAAWALKR